MITFKVQLKMFRDDYEGMQRDFNRIVREVLVETGHWWIENVLMDRFRATAVQEFRFTQRSQKWLEMKLRRGLHKHMVFTGELIEQVESQSYRPKATATANKAKLVIRIPIPHPIRSKYSGELGKLRRGDMKVLHKYAIGRMQKRMADEVLKAKQSKTIGP